MQCWSSRCAQWQGDGQAISADKADSQFLHLLVYRRAWDDQCDTNDAMDFPEIWAEIAPQIQGLPLVAHNSPFDESCLKAAFEAYDMEYPGYRFYCTCHASRKLLGDKLPNHQLQTVAAYCGYDLTKHHHAMADAEACAAIAIKLIDL